MEVGVHLIFANQFETRSDQEQFMAEVASGVIAEQQGFDSVWSVEHHFDSYSMCPSNTQVLAFIAAQTSKIKLGTAAIILPWHDPLRVVAEIIALDNLSDGRLHIGFGRGLAQMEYDGWRQDMNESKERFVEAADFVMRALANGYAEGDGKYYKQPRVALRPAPTRSFADRACGVAMSPGSAVPMAELGLGLMAFLQGPAETHAEGYNAWKAHWLEHQQAPLPPLWVSELTYCHEDPDVAREVGYRSIGDYYDSLMDHYSMLGDHFATTTGYENYAQAGEYYREVGRDAAADAYITAQAFGTPEQIIERIKERNDVFGGNLNSAFIFRHGSLTDEQAMTSQELFAREVLPVIREL